MSNKVKPLIVTTEEAGQRLDKWIKFHFSNISKIMVEKLCRTGQIRVDSARVKPNIKLFENQLIRIPNFIRYNNKKIDKVFTNRDTDLFNKLKEAIVYEDDYFLIFNKPFGLAVQGGSKLGNVHLDGILPLFSKNKFSPPKLVHRLDKETSGILVVAKTSKSASEFSKLMVNRKILKSYWALVISPPKNKSGILYNPSSDTFLLKKDLIEKYGLDKEFIKAKLFTLNSENKETVSTYKEIKVQDNFSWLKLWAITGRKHQLRKQLADIGCPIIGDDKYGQKEKILRNNIKEKLQLHAREIIFKNPITDKLIKVKCSPPDHMKEFLNTGEINKF